MAEMAILRHPNARPVQPKSRTSSGQIDTVATIVKEWTQTCKTGKVILNFHQGRLNTAVVEETFRYNR